MKRLIILILMIVMCGSVMAEKPKMLLGGRLFLKTGMEPVALTSFGFSQKLPWFDNGNGALYAAGFGKRSESGKVGGGDLELVYFPNKPLSYGMQWDALKIFMIITGVNVTQVEEAQSVDPVTFLQVTSGFGVHWLFSSETAVFLAFKLEKGQDLSTTHIGLGMSTRLW